MFEDSVTEFTGFTGQFVRLSLVSSPFPPADATNPKQVLSLLLLQDRAPKLAKLPYKWLLWFMIDITINNVNYNGL